jgi:hypothetical protein
MVRRQRGGQHAFAKQLGVARQCIPVFGTIWLQLTLWAVLAATVTAVPLVIIIIMLPIKP